MTRRISIGVFFKTKIECPSARVQHALTAVRRRYADHELDLSEGIKVIWPDTHAWLHIRPSNTEPVIRAIAESDTEAEAQELCEEALAILVSATEA